MVRELDDVFSGKTEAEQPVEQEETEVEEVEAEEAETETETDETATNTDDDEDAEVDETTETTAVKDTKEEKTVPIAALKDERRKRQALEDELKKIKEKQTENTAEVEETEEPDETTKAIREEVWKATTNISRAAMKRQHEDYEDMEKVFIELAGKDKSLAQDMRNSEDPAYFAYTTAKAHLELKALTDPVKVAELKAQIRADVLKELGIDNSSKGKNDDKKKSAVSVPDLTTATANGNNSVEKPKAPTLDDALAGAPF